LGSHDSYQSPLAGRYASQEMLAAFSDDMKFSTWRKLWIALAKAEKQLGVPIPEGAIEEMEAHIYDIDYEKAAEYERAYKHDVMAHIHAYGDVAPRAAGIIHLGATSAYVGDNADLIIFAHALGLIKKSLVNAIDALSAFAEKTKALPTLAFTHFQPAQPTTVGKRACMWAQDLLLDYEELCFVLGSMRLRGVKGATGTQASFLELFEGNEEKVKALSGKVLEALGWERDFPVTGQTYPRKMDSRILACLSSIAQSLHKMATDIRLLQGLKEIEEPFSVNQVGSSAMPYKRNPMKAERICSLSRYVMTQAINPQLTASVQPLERTLDDSANRRIAIPEAFLALDGALLLACEVVRGLEVNDMVIASDLTRELPFMMAENILMKAVKNGGDRQVLHEKLREHSVASGNAIKKEGKPNPLLSLIASDESFPISAEELAELSDAKLYTGRAERLTEEFLNEYVRPVLKENAELLGMKPESRV